MTFEELEPLAREVLTLCRAAGLKLATAESCTGGLVAAALTEIAGSSDVVERGFVTYSNEAKTELLGVAPTLIADHGAVSEPVARAMAEGVLSRVAGAGLAVAVTGIAGPGGATPAKPVGLVHFAASAQNRPTRHERRVFPGDRRQVRLAAASFALGLLREIAKESA